MQRDKEYLLDILEASKLAIQYVQGKSLEDFLSDIQCQDAVIRRLEIIGEAARRVSDETREAHPELPWHKMVGIRNVMIHEYNDVDPHLVWDTAYNRLPSLVHSLEEILSA